MRRMVVLVSGALAAVGLALPTAEAVGTGNPVIESPTAATKLYAGFKGPFVTDLSNAPIGTYDYYVDKVPSGGGVPVLVGSKKTYDFNGSFEKPQLTTSALPAGTGYAFHVTDNGGHETSLSFTVLPGPPPTCSLVLPRQVRMKARSNLVHAKLGAQCAALHTTYASWEARHPRAGFAERFTFADTSTDTWRIYDDEYTGLYTIRPSSAKDDTNQAVPQNTTYLTMRMDSRLSLTSQRAGAFVTLRTKEARYSPVANHYVAWGKRTVVLSYRTCSTCAWHRLTVRTSDKHGALSYRVRAAGRRQYRATANGTSTTWAPLPSYTTR